MLAQQLVPSCGGNLHKTRAGTICKGLNSLDLSLLPDPGPPRRRRRFRRLRRLRGLRSCCCPTAVISFMICNEPTEIASVILHLLERVPLIVQVEEVTEVLTAND